MSMSGPARAAARAAVHRLRQGLGELRPQSIEAVVAEDRFTILLFAPAPGRTVTAAVTRDQIGGTPPEVLARYIEEALSQ
jgi:hypothetical protein